MTTVLYDQNGALATITLNRPECLNAINKQMRLELLQAIERAESDEGVCIVIIKGSGAGFCAGADLRENSDNQSIGEQLEQEYKPFLLAIDQGEKLYIAQIHNIAAGIGGALALTCDLCVMARDASIYLAFAAIGIVPDGGKTWHLVKAMGYSRALQTIIEGQKIPAQQCLELGLVNKVAATDQLEQTTAQWAVKLAEGAPLAQRAAKRLLKKVAHVSYGQAISLEAEEQELLTKSEDFKNAVAAFLDKRNPVFEGR